MIIPLPFHYWPDPIRSSSPIHHGCDRSNWTHFSDHYQPASAIFTPRFMGQIHPLNSIFFDESFSEIFFFILSLLSVSYALPSLSQVWVLEGYLHLQGDYIAFLYFFLTTEVINFRKKVFHSNLTVRFRKSQNEVESLFVYVSGFFPPPQQISWWSVSFCRSEDIRQFHAGGHSPFICVTASIIR